MGAFDNIDTVSIQFSNAKIDHAAGDTIILDTIFDDTRNHIKTDAFSNIRLAIISILTHGCLRTTDTSRITTFANGHVPLYFKNKHGLRRGIRDNSKIMQVFKEFNKDPEHEDFGIYIDCDALFYHPNFDGYNFDDISNDPKDIPSPTAPGTPSTNPMMTTPILCKILLPCLQSFYINFRKL